MENGFCVIENILVARSVYKGATVIFSLTEIHLVVVENVG
jgi:hypothetical protein